MKVTCTEIMGSRFQLKIMTVMRANLIQHTCIKKLTRCDNLKIFVQYYLFVD
jgi:hypothetical protein